MASLLDSRWFRGRTRALLRDQERPVGALSLGEFRRERGPLSPGIAADPDPVALLDLELRRAGIRDALVVAEEELLQGRVFGRREVAVHAAEHAVALRVAQELDFGDPLVLVFAVGRLGGL